MSTSQPSGGAMSRRLFLRRSAAATAIGAAGLGQQAQAEIVENPELHRLCDEFDAQMTAYHQMVELKDSALARYNALVPPVPKEIIAGWNDRFLAELENDAECNPVRQPDGYQRLIISSHACERNLKVHGWQHESIRQKSTIAKQYEDALEAARKTSGLEACLYAVYGKRTAATKLAESIAVTQAETPLGLIRKATVAHAMATIDQECVFRMRYIFGEDFWTEIVAVLGKAAAS